MSRETERYPGSSDDKDMQANPADVAEQSLPAFPGSDLDLEEGGSEFPLEADPADVSEQRQAAPRYVEQPEE